MAWLRSSIVPRQEFLEAGITLVQINPGTLLAGFTVRFSGEPLRTEVVPPYRKTRKKLRRTSSGAADAELARDLEKYADDVIAMTKDGADDIDAGRGFVFDFGDKPAALLRRLEDAQRSIAVEVLTRVDALDASTG